jgi:hypothetical protein
MALTTWKPHTLYILLSSRNNPGTFHWGLYLTETNPQSGFKYHAIEDSSAPRGWRLDIQPTSGVSASQQLIAAIAVGEDTKDYHGIIEQAVRDVWTKTDVPGRKFTCRTFVSDCIQELAQTGVVTLKGSSSTVEDEAKRIGMLSDPALSASAQRGRVWKSLYCS